MALGMGIVTIVSADGIEREHYIDNVTGYEFGSVNGRFSGVLIVMTKDTSHYYAPGRWVEFALLELDEETATDG